jgi:hypothetical protein
MWRETIQTAGEREKLRLTNLGEADRIPVLEGYVARAMEQAEDLAKFTDSLRSKVEKHEAIFFGHAPDPWERTYGLSPDIRASTRQHEMRHVEDFEVSSELIESYWSPELKEIVERDWGEEVASSRYRTGLEVRAMLAEANFAASQGKPLSKRVGQTYKAVHGKEYSAKRDYIKYRYGLNTDALRIPHDSPLNQRTPLPVALVVGPVAPPAWKWPKLRSRGEAFGHGGSLDAGKNTAGATRSANTDFGSGLLAGLTTRGLAASSLRKAAPGRKAGVIGKGQMKATNRRAHVRRKRKLQAQHRGGTKFIGDLMDGNYRHNIQGYGVNIPG